MQTQKITTTNKHTPIKQQTISLKLHLGALKMAPYIANKEEQELSASTPQYLRNQKPIEDLTPTCWHEPIVGLNSKVRGLAERPSPNFKTNPCFHAQSFQLH